MLGNIVAGTFSAGVPPVTSSYESIATVTVGSGGQASIDFTSLSSYSSDYKHLQIRAIVKTAFANAQDGLKIQMNGATGSSYNYHYVGGNGSGSGYAGAGGASAQTFMQSVSVAGATNADIFGVVVLDILDAFNTNKNKVLRAIGGVDNNGAGVVEMWSGLYLSTSATDSIKLYSFNGSNISQYSSFALYGIKD
jgi:hypothetical protein